MSTPAEKMYLQFFYPYLNADEKLLEAIPAISEEVAKRDRSDREGTIAVTNQRMLFVSVQGRLWHNYDLAKMRSVERERMLVPGNAWLVVKPGVGYDAKFMVGKKQIGFFLPAAEGAIRRAKAPNG